MLGTECDLKMYVTNLGYQLPLQMGAQSLYLLNETWWTNALELQEVSYIASKVHELWSTNG